MKIKQGISGLEDLKRYGDVDSYRGIRQDHVAEVVEGDYRDLSIEQNDIVLENYIFDTGRNMFFVDDHNHALAGWIAALYEGLMQGETLLAHVDFHEDGKEPPTILESEEGNFTQELPAQVPISMGEINRVVPNLEINEFIEPALQWKMFDEVENIGLGQKTGNGYRTETESIQKLDIGEYDSVIADIDIDFYKGLNGDYHQDGYSCDAATVREFEEQVASLITGADFVTWATSPGIMNQEEAIEKIEGLVTLSDQF